MSDPEVILCALSPKGHTYGQNVRAVRAGGITVESHRMFFQKYNAATRMNQKRPREISAASDFALKMPEKESVSAAYARGLNL